MRTNYVLIDFENVQPEELSELNAEHFKVFVFIGANQRKLGVPFVTAMQALGSRGEYVQIAGNGSNALDFHIAYYIGKLASADASAFFHIISKDTGFDPLIQHLKVQGIFASRAHSVGEMKIIKAGHLKPDERVEFVIANFERRGASKPRAVKTLQSTIDAIFQKQLPEPEVLALIKKLQTRNYLSVSGTKVTYESSGDGTPPK